MFKLAMVLLGVTSTAVTDVTVGTGAYSASIVMGYKYRGHVRRRT